MRYVFVWLDLPPCTLCDGIFCYGPLRTEVQGYWWCIIIIAVLNTGHYIAYSKHPTTIVRGTREAAALTRRAERQWLLLCYLLQDTHCGQSNFKRSTHNEVRFCLAWLATMCTLWWDFLLRTIKDWGPRLLMVYYYYCKATFLQYEHASNCLLLLCVAAPLTFTQTSVPKCCHRQNMPHPSCN